MKQNPAIRQPVCLLEASAPYGIKEPKSEAHAVPK